MDRSNDGLYLSLLVTYLTTWIYQALSYVFFFVTDLFDYMDAPSYDLYCSLIYFTTWIHQVMNVVDLFVTGLFC